MIWPLVSSSVSFVCVFYYYYPFLQCLHRLFLNFLARSDPKMDLCWANKQRKIALNQFFLFQNDPLFDKNDSDKWTSILILFKENTKIEQTSDPDQQLANINCRKSRFTICCKTTHLNHRKTFKADVKSFYEFL